MTQLDPKITFTVEWLPNEGICLSTISEQLHSSSKVIYQDAESVLEAIKIVLSVGTRLLLIKKQKSWLTGETKS